MSPLKILLTVHQFLPEYFSGTEILTYSVAKELLKRGHEVFVLTGFPARTQLPDEERFDEYEHEGIRVFRFHHAYVPMGGQTAVTEVEYDNHLAARYFARLVRDLKPDVVHFFHLSRLGGGLIDVAVKAGIPAYSTPTDFWSVCPTSQLLLKDGRVCAGPSRFGGNCVKHVAELTRGPAVGRAARLTPTFAADIVAGLTAKGALPNYPMSREVAAMARRRPFLVERLNWLAGIVSPTKLMTDVLTANGVDAARIVPSAYGIDVAHYDAKPVTRDPAKPLVVGFIGTLARHKGCHVLIDAVRRLDAAKVQLKIYGNPSDFPDYVADLKARAGAAANIEFCGTFPNAKVAEVLAGVDVLVVPSLWYENTPLVVYSALAAKRPLVISDFPGLAEVVKHGWNGLAFPAGDVVALSTQLTRLIGETDLLGQLSSNCQRPKSSVEYVDELLALYALGKVKHPSAPRTFDPLEDTRGLGFITGWAVAGFSAPARITVLKNNETLGETNRFLPRPDVRDGLMKGGAKVNGAHFGFAVQIREAFTHNELIIRIEDAQGRRVDCALADIAVGASRHLGGGDFIGLDSERQPQRPS